MRNGWNWKYPLSYMYPAHTQLVAKCSSPSIGDQRATGCSSYDDVSISKLFWIFWKYTSWSPLPHMMMIIYCDMRIMSWDMMRIIFRPLLALLRLSIIIDYHWLSMIIIDYHWLSLIVIDYHWLSLKTFDYHRLSLINIDHHWLSLIIIDYHGLS